MPRKAGATISIGTSSSTTPSKVGSLFVTAVHPRSAIEGGRITIEGSGFAVDESTLPEVYIGDTRARIVRASSRMLAAVVPAGLEAGRATVRVDGSTAFVDVAAPFATGLHQVDNPVFDQDGNL